MAASAPDYENIRLGGPGGLRYPLEVGKGVFLVQADSGTVPALSSTLSAAAQPTLRLVDSEPTLGYAGSTAITGSVAAVRGNATLGASTTISSGFVYGEQGKLTLKGTLANGSGFNAGLFGQVDTSASTFVHTSGYLAPIMGDFGATSIMSTDANANMVSLLNTTSCLINSALLFIGNASYAFDLTDLGAGGAHFIVGTTGSTASGCLKVKINGVAKYIQLFTTVA
jgi:hypothetical protein